MKAIILAAGFATRLYPLTLHQPKPLLDIGGRPMLSWLVDKILEVGEIDEIVVIGNERFHSQFLEWRDSYASSLPIQILNDGSTTDDNKLGAIGDMNFAMRQVNDGEDMLIVAGDNLLEFSLVPYFEKFQSVREPLILLREIQEIGRRSRYNEVMVDDEGVVTSFREKPEDPKSNLVAICLYFFPAEVKQRISEYLSGGNNPDAPGYFIQWLVRQVRVRAAKFEGQWFDIGNFQTLEEARARYSQQASNR